MKIERISRAFWLAFVASAFLSTSQPAQAQPAPDSNSVLILGSTVTGGDGSAEAVQAAALGFTVVVDSDAAWGARSTADFATFKAQSAMCFMDES